MNGPQLSREQLEMNIRRSFEREAAKGDLSSQEWQEVLAKTRRHKQRRRWHLFGLPFLPSASRPAAAAVAVATSFLLFFMATGISELVTGGVGGLACPGYPPAVFVERADTVLVGTIRSANQPPWTWITGARAEVEVERYLKGSGPEVVTVRASGLLARATGWPEQRIDRRGVLFLKGEGSNLRDDPCSGSRWVFPPAPEQLERFLSEVEAVTGPGSTPEPGAAGGDGLPAGGLTVGLLLMLFLGLSAYLLKRKRAVSDG